MYNAKLNMDKIVIKGARVHNLKNIDLEIPRDKLVVITGLSGSGKSSLAFDTIYAEGQRRYIESLSSYARQFLGVMDKPDVDKIEGLSPAIAIDQKSISKNPRSTVGTITEIYDYLRLLFARIGKPHCPKCGRPVSKQSVSQIADQILKLPAKSEIAILAPVIRGKKGEHRGILEEIQRAGYLRVRVDKTIHLVEEAIELKLDRYKIHDIEAVIDRLVVDKRIDKPRLVDSLETGLKIGKGLVMANVFKSGKKARKSDDLIFSEMFACPECEINLPQIEPRLFSFNSPYGACPACTGLGTQLEVSQELVIPNKNLTLAEGAIRPWASASHRVGRQSWYWYILSELAERHNFSLNVPVKELPKEVIDLILNGEKNGKFEGVIPNLKRRWKETESEWTRAELEKYMVIQKCPACGGRRLMREALAVLLAGKNIYDTSSLDISAAKNFFENLLDGGLKVSEKPIAAPIVKEIIGRLQFLIDVGLEYLTLERESTTLAGGEAQRIRLATQIGSRLVGVLYILDEPSVGLHPRDHARLIETLRRLRDLGNTVLVVEHDAQTILAADWVVDLGPGAGRHGGEVIFQGTPDDLKKAKTLTADYLFGRKTAVMKRREAPALNEKENEKNLVVKGAAEHNLKNIDVKIPLGKFVCVSGVSGSGKSTLVNDILAKALAAKFYRAQVIPGRHEEILGIEHIDKVISVDQSPIGRTPRSNPATYTGIFTVIRDLFAKSHEAKIRGYGAGRFSFNVKGGRCEHCEGQGLKKIEMHFLPDVYVECEECRGSRYNQEALEIEYKGKNIAQVLKMTVEDAMKFFEKIPALHQKLTTLFEVGLGYVELGQPATTLSGGEAQRIKLASELSRRGTGRTFYILDEPTTGLHFDDIRRLLGVLSELVNKGNTVLVIEHNLDVLRSADWLIDLGPEGGEGGGRVIAEGSPEEIAKNKKSYTGEYLKGFVQKSKL